MGSRAAQRFGDETSEPWSGIHCKVLFFFEAAFFVVAIAVLVVAETAGRGLALALWAGLTALSLLAGLLVRLRLARSPASDRADERGRRMLTESLRHLNLLLVLGLLALAAWWWIGSSTAG